MHMFKGLTRALVLIVTLIFGSPMLILHFLG